MSLLNRIPFCDAYFVLSALTLNVIRLVQLLNALLPMEVTLSGNVTFVRLAQPVNAPKPMEVTPLSIVTLVRLEQYSNA